MTKIAMVVGSLRKGSYNRQLACHIAESLERHAEVSWLDYAGLPPMNQDLEWPVPEAVARVRAEVAEADGLWVVCPEYNRSYPGHVKNLVDWLSRPTDPSSQGPATATINGKKATISGVAGKSGARNMMAGLVDTLEFAGADVMVSPVVTVALAPEAFAADTLALSEDHRLALAEQVDAFYAYVVGTPGVPNLHDTTSVPAEPSEGGVFARSEEVGGCSEQGCSVHHRA